MYEKEHIHWLVCFITSIFSWTWQIIHDLCWCCDGTMLICRFWIHLVSWLRAQLEWKRTSSKRNPRNLMHQPADVALGDCTHCVSLTHSQLAFHLLLQFDLNCSHVDPICWKTVYEVQIVMFDVICLPFWTSAYLVLLQML